MNGVSMKGWEERFPGLFESASQYGKTDKLEKLTVCHNKMEWKVDPERTPYSNTGVTYEQESG